ncbi:PAS domain-containing protein [Paracoccus marcusii]|nr:PAS domain-containing protein [Paracoccus marcusii]
MMPAFFGCVILALGLVVWLLQVDARRQIDEMGTAATDNTQWFLAQSEVEVLALQRAALLLATPGAGADQARDLRQRFDIFYSRIQTLQQGRTYDHLRAEPGISTALMAIQSGLDAAVPVIDGDDAGLIAGLPRIMPIVDAAVPWLGRCRWRVRLFAEKSALRREGVARALTTLSLLVVPLFMVLAGSVVVLAAMVRSAGERNRRIAAVSNRLNSLFEASIDAILVARPDGRILGFNAAAQRIYGYDRAEAVGADVVDLLTRTTGVPRCARFWPGSVTAPPARAPAGPISCRPPPGTSQAGSSPSNCPCRSPEERTDRWWSPLCATCPDARPRRPN